MNNYYQPTQQQMQMPVYQQAAPARYQQVPTLKGRPVASIEEARATAIDFDGSIFYFPDVANRRIYTKQINIDGTPSFQMYELKEIPIQSSNDINYITRDEFNLAMSQIKEAMDKQVPKKVQESAKQEFSF